MLKLAGAEETSGAHSFDFNPAHPLATAAIAGGPAIPDGTYAVTLSYVDPAGKVVTSATNSRVVIDAVDSATRPPTLAAPATGSTTRSPVSVDFTLPEAAKAGSVKLTFVGAVTAVS